MSSDSKGRERADSWQEYHDARERGYNPGVPEDRPAQQNGATAEECAEFFRRERAKKLRK